MHGTVITTTPNNTPDTTGPVTSEFPEKKKKAQKNSGTKITS